MLRPDYPPESNVSLVDLLKKMFIKDANERISLEEITRHDWVTSNGVNPMPRVIYPKVELTNQDTQNLFKRVMVISKIKLKLRNQIARRRATVMQSQLLQSQFTQNPHLQSSSTNINNNTTHV